MTHEDAFIADIIANPADDAVRLIYADWLDGQGREEYGEFIRVQCELWADLPRDKPFALGSEERYDRWRYLMEREQELLNAHGWRWAGDAAPFIGPPKVWHKIFSRGFISEVRLSCSNWITHGPALVRRQPIERVVLVDKKPVTHTPGLWRWAHDEPNFRHTGHSSLLPGELFDLLDGQPPGHWHFDSEAAAIDALSAAALLWARQTEPAAASA